jgi:phosphoglycolate phosphatase
LKFDNIKYLLFDLDGTLIDSSEGVIFATNYALSALGEPIRAAAEICKFIGHPLEEMFHSFSDKSYSEFWGHFQSAGLEKIASSSFPIDGADDALLTLVKSGYIIGIGTTKMRIHIDKIISKLGWADYIAGYCGADDVAHVKPAPDVFLKVMNLLGGNRYNSLVIGDTINDVLAARAAQLPVIAIESPFGNNAELKTSGPDLYLSSIRELPEALIVENARPK